MEFSPLQHMENAFVIFLLSKNDFWAIVLLHSSAQLVYLHLGGKQTKSFKFTYGQYHMLEDGWGSLGWRGGGVG